jgi:hypothetical protein
LLHVDPTCTTHAPGCAHHRAALHARVPSASCAQHPVEHSAPLLHLALQIRPAPGSAAHAVATPLTGQHSSAVAHAFPAVTEHDPPLSPVHTHALYALPAALHVCAPARPSVQLHAIELPATHMPGASVLPSIVGVTTQARIETRTVTAAIAAAMRDANFKVCRV